MIGGGYLVFAIIICNAPAYFLHEQNYQHNSLFISKLFLRQSLFFQSTIIASLVVSIVLNIISNNQKIRAFKTATKLITTIILFIPSVLSFFYLINWCLSSHVLESDALIAFFQTNLAEANAFFNSFLQLDKLVAILIVLCVFVISSLLLSSELTISLSKKTWYTLSFAIILILQPLFIYNYNIITAPFFKTYEILNQYQLFSKMTSQREQLAKSIHKETNKKTKGTWVIVIGESLNRDFMGVYGYKRDTTPWQSSIRKLPNTVFFENAFSCHAQTVQVLTYALTQKNQYNNANISYGKALSIVDLSRFGADYNTIWISNQQKIGVADTPIAAIACSTNYQYWMNKNDWRSNNRGEYDEVVVNQLKTITLDKSGNIIFIHLMGSHSEYVDRYPPKYNIFTEDDTNTNKYNNSVNYNDDILRQLYESSIKLPNFRGLIYFSDHGEDVYRRLGHNAADFTWDMTKIPFWIIFSEDYIKENYEKFKVLKEHESTPFTNDLLFDSLLGILDIKDQDYYSPENDISSKTYNHTFYDLKTLHGKKDLTEMKLN
jgi:heptose-I-phosphate ethanolaminephosphotransferase